MSWFKNIARYKSWFIWILLGVVAFIGVLIAPTYGTGWDESISIQGAEETIEYLQNIGNTDAALWTSETRYYGVAYELPLAYVTDEVMGFTSTHDILVFRHIMTFLFFIIGVYVFYLFCYRRFGSVWLPLVGALMFILSPRIFADAFYNSKDIPAMVLFIISAFTMVRLLDAPSYKRLAWHALAVALLIDIRLPGLLMVAITIGLLLGCVEHKQEIRKAISMSLFFSLLVASLVFMFWPYLWQDPFTHFLEALADMSRFSRQANLQMLFAGNFVSASAIPWYYIPLWITLTTPILYILFFLLGSAVLLGVLLRNPLTTLRTNTQDVLVLTWFFGPLVAVISLHSILYDGWRQLYFIYPALLYCSLIGISTVFDAFGTGGMRLKRIGIYTISALLLIQCVFTFSFMKRNHPYQNLYFNLLTGGEENARKTFEMDYWGLTFREGLEYIAEHDSDLVIRVFFSQGNTNNPSILYPDQKRRFVIAETPGEAKYVLSNYREQVYEQLPWDKEWYSVRVDGAKVMTIFKLR